MNVWQGCVLGFLLNSFSSSARCPAVPYPDKKLNHHLKCTETPLSHRKQAVFNLILSLFSIFSPSDDWQLTCRQLLASACELSLPTQWDVSPTLADSCHMTVQMGGQQIQSLWLECADIWLGQFTLTMSLSLKTCCYPPPPKLEWFIGESRVITVFQLRFAGALPVFLSSDVWCVYSGSEVQLKYSPFMTMFMKQAASETLLTWDKIVAVQLFERLRLAFKWNICFLLSNPIIWTK